jgi:hypothetical protein
MFDKLFEEAGKRSLESFTDADLRREGIVVPQLPSDDIAVEGIVRAKLGEAGKNFTDVYSEMKGWTQGVESKRRYLNELCEDDIAWLKDKDSDYKNLDLDMGRFYTWMKTSETMYWRFFFVLSDEVFNDIVKQIKKDEITDLEVLTNMDIKERAKVTRKLDSVKTVKDLIVVMEKYRSRCNMIFEGLGKRKRKLQSFPYQIMLLGQKDLSRTLKKIVNLAI